MESPAIESRSLPHNDFINVQDRSPERLKTAVPVLISPGWSENPVVFEDTINELIKSGRRVIAVSYSGIRESESVPNQPALEVGKAEAILGVLKAKNLSRVDVVAHSEGSIAAIIAASVEPERFRSLILVDPAGFIGKDDFPKLAGRFSKKVIRDHFRLLFDSHSRKPLARFLKEGAKFAVTHPVQGLKEAVAISKTQLENLLGELHTSGMKVAIVSGVDDPVFPMQRLQRIVKSHMIDGFLSVKGGHDEIHLQPKYAKAIEKLIADINKVSIPLPDIENHEKFEAWLDQYITPEHYHKGFDDLKEDGIPSSMEKRVEGTKEQCRKYEREGAQLRQFRPGRFSIHQTAEMIRGLVEQIHANTT